VTASYQYIQCMSVSSAVYTGPAAAVKLARTMPPATIRSPSLGRAMGTTLKTRRRPRGPAEAFGPRLRRIREARGFSQGQLGQAIGASQRMIAYYETHAEKAPARHLTALAQVLRVSVDELVGYRPVETPAGRANPRLWHRLRQVRGPAAPGPQAGSPAHRHPHRAGDPQEAGAQRRLRKRQGPVPAVPGERSGGPVQSAASVGRTQQADSGNRVTAR